MSTATKQPHPGAQPGREVDELMSRLPRQADELAFDEPWQLRALALAVATHKAGQYPWSDFQEALIASIKSWEESTASAEHPTWSYYEHWVNAFEAVLDESGALDHLAVDARTLEVLAVPPNRNHHEPHYDPIAVAPAIRSSQGENP